MKLLTKAEVEALIGPIDSWGRYYLAMALAGTAAGQPPGVERFLLAIAALEHDGVIQDPSKSPILRAIVEGLSDEALVAALAVQVLIEVHEEGGEFETAQTLRAAQAVAQAEITKRHRRWDA